MLQRTTGALIAKLGVLALAFCGVVAVAYGLLRGDWIGGALSGITLAIALLPEEFPMVLAIFMALGAFRLARHNVLVRRAAVIETLGAATFLCVDKTGTLTENRMALTTVWRDGNAGGDHRLGQAPGRGRACPADRHAGIGPPPGRSDGPRRSGNGHPVGARGGAGGSASPDLSAPSRAPRLHSGLAGGQGGVLYAAKGAPEAIFRLCRMGEGGRRALSSAASMTAATGPKTSSL